MMFPPDVMNRISEIICESQERVTAIDAWNKSHPGKPPEDPELFVVRGWLAREAERLGLLEIRGDAHGRACHNAHRALWRLLDNQSDLIIQEYWHHLKLGDPA